MTSGAVTWTWTQDELNTLMDWDAPRVKGTLTIICDYLASRPGELIPSWEIADAIAVPVNTFLGAIGNLSPWMKANLPYRTNAPFVIFQNRSGGFVYGMSLYEAELWQSFRASSEVFI